MTYKIHKQYRMRGYDYSRNGKYFITIITKHRKKYFGNIENGKMIFSGIGRLVDQNFILLKSKELKILVEQHAILPDHLHMILSIENNVEEENEIYNGLHPLSKDSISLFVNHLKGHIKKSCNKEGYKEFEWQARFHDRIIRDDEEYERVSLYIEHNVPNWKNDIP